MPSAMVIWKVCGPVGSLVTLGLVLGDRVTVIAQVPCANFLTGSARVAWEVPFDTSWRRVRAPTRIHRVSMLARVDTTRRHHRCLAVHAVT